MAVVPMQKVKIFVHKKDKDSLLNFLQESGQLEAIDVSGDQNVETHELSDQGQHEVEYDLAQVEYAFNYLEPYAKAKKGLQKIREGESVRASIAKIEEVSAQFCYKDIVNKVQRIDEELVKIQNELKAKEELLFILKPWKNLPFALNESWATNRTKTKIGTVDLLDLELIRQEFINKTPNFCLDVVSEDEVNAYLVVTYLKTEEAIINELFQEFKFSEISLAQFTESPQTEISKIKSEIKELEKSQQELEKECQKLALEIDNLKITFDALTWKRDQKATQKRFFYTNSTVLISGWIPQTNFDAFNRTVVNKFKNIEIIKCDLNEGEEPPVIISNSDLIKPFESVTRIYGLPLPHEIDPTPYLSVFFVLAFAFCLTDAIYGGLLMGLSLIFIKLFQIPKKEQGLLRLLIYSGFFTIILGVLFGGWMGLTVEDLPFMAQAAGSNYFVGQVIKPDEAPLLLLGLAFAFGYIQLVFGKVVDGISNIKQGKVKESFLDSFSWVYLLLAILFYVLTVAVPALSAYATIVQYAIWAGVIFMIFTQGRDKKNIVGKFFSGVLSLYGLVGFMSDTLSYARLMALGLATGIIASSINRIAFLFWDMIPVVGIVVFVLVMIFGHLFNLALNALGSFIHSGRLQFIEFFGKFMEGGGKEFEPLQKRTRFIRVAE